MSGQEARSAAQDQELLGFVVLERDIGGEYDMPIGLGLLFLPDDRAVANPRYGSLGSPVVRYVQAQNVLVGDVIDGVPITHKSVQQEFVWLSTDDGRSMKLAHSYLIPVDRRQA